MRDADTSAALVADEPPGIVDASRPEHARARRGPAARHAGARGDESSARVVRSRHAPVRGAAQDARAGRPPPTDHARRKGGRDPARHRPAASPGARPAAAARPDRASERPRRCAHRLRGRGGAHRGHAVRGRAGRRAGRAHARCPERRACRPVARARGARARAAPLPLRLDGARLRGADGAGAAERPGQRARVRGAGRRRGSLLPRARRAGGRRR